MTMTIGLLAFPDMEMLDYAGPYQVFASASSVAKENPEDPELFHLVTIGETAGCVPVRAGASLCVQYTLDDHPELSCLIIPGGMAGVDPAIDRGRIVPWLVDQATKVPVVASVCTGAFLLAQSGLLHAMEATTHHSRVDDLRYRFPSIDVIESRRWVDSGRFVTSAGITAGIDMAIHLVERLASRDLAVATARRLEL